MDVELLSFTEECLIPYYRLQMCECRIGGKIDYRKTNFDILPRIDMISKKLGDSV